MSRLTIYDAKQPASAALLQSDDSALIAAELAKAGIVFERWHTHTPLAAGADDRAVLDAYQDDITRLTERGGYQAVDVIRLERGNAAATELRAKFLAEHTHADDEVRFFVEGAGQFYLHLNGRVYVVLCEAGDLISVPAGTRHWFDMGPDPYFTAIRLFVTPAGWVADFTGDAIASSFPKFEGLPL